MCIFSSRTFLTEYRPQRFVALITARCCPAIMVGFVAGAVLAPTISHAASYRLYKEVSQAWAARGFSARAVSSTAYRAPGPASDPWGPYIQAAAHRFAIPDTWIRAVMHQESGGKQYLNGDLTTSGAGAMGLMQLMPATYADMQSQYNLGSDPYDPRDNIQAGAAYIRLMYDKYGAPGFLAAYNAGPNRVDDYLNTGRALPDETVNYVASITPHLGGGVAVRGNWAPVPLSQTGASITTSEAFYTQENLTRTADGCLRDPNAAYDPSAPCLMDRDIPHPNPEEQAEPQTPVLAQAVEQPSSTEQATQPVQTVAFSREVVEAPMQRANLKPVQAPWAMQNARTVFAKQAAHTLVLPEKYQSRERETIALGSNDSTLKRVQVGAFSTYAEARRMAAKGTQLLASRSVYATPTVSTVSVSGKPLYRAQLVAQGPVAAGGVCQVLRAGALPCIQIRNG